MGKPTTYKGKGPWLIGVNMPEKLAQQVNAILIEYGISFTEFARRVLTAHVEKVAHK